MPRSRGSVARSGVSGPLPPGCGWQSQPPPGVRFTAPNRHRYVRYRRRYVAAPQSSQTAPRGARFHGINHLAAVEVRRTLLDEGLDAFAKVLGRLEHAVREALEVEAGVERDVVDVVQYPLGRRERDRRQRVQLRDDATDGVVQVAPGDGV